MKQYENVNFKNFTRPEFSVVWSNTDKEDWNPNNIENMIELQSYDSEFSFVPKKQSKRNF